MGDGGVIDRLADVGVKRIEWILLTDHHRENCQGIRPVDRSVTKIATSADERELLEKPTEFRKWFSTLGDKYSVYGASYVRPPQQPILIDKSLSDKSFFTWHGYEIKCLHTPGHSPGGVSYLIRRNGNTVAFTGGVMHNKSKMTNWFDTEWDYGFAKGIDTLIESVQRLTMENIDAALVSAYGTEIDGMKTEKPFREGETVEWEGYTIHIDWMPGQTEFGCCLWLEIDGKRIAFTGDNLFGNPADKTQNGHEAVACRNSAIFEEGYVLGSKYLLDLNPDIVMGSHSYVMPEPREFLERYHAWSKEMVTVYRSCRWILPWMTNATDNCSIF